MQPLYYRESADAPWKEWLYGNVDGRSLVKRNKEAVTINGVSVHTLQFGPYDEWDCEVGKKVFTPPKVEPTPAPTPAPTEPPRVVLDPQEYAMRVWRNQSPDTIGLSERRARVRAALEAQGLSMDGVTLPG